MNGELINLVTFTIGVSNEGFSFDSCFYLSHLQIYKFVREFNIKVVRL
jgi:hypothetical protein